jgi:hypothetical protein
MSIVFADAIFWVAVACCTIAQLAILRSILATPRTPEASASFRTARRAIEAAWAILPGLALAVLLCFTWAAIHTAASTTIVP